MIWRFSLILSCLFLFASTASAARWPRAYMVSPKKIQIDFTQPVDPDDAVDLGYYSIRKKNVGHVQVQFATLMTARNVELDVIPAQPICTADRYILSLRKFSPTQKKFLVHEMEFGTFCP